MTKPLNSLYHFVSQSLLFVSLSALYSLSPFYVLCLPSLSQTHTHSLRHNLKVSQPLPKTQSLYSLHLSVSNLHHQSITRFQLSSSSTHSQLKYQSFYSQFLTLHYTFTYSITHCDLIFFFKF